MQYSCVTHLYFRVKGAENMSPDGAVATHSLPKRGRRRFTSSSWTLGPPNLDPQRSYLRTVRLK